MIQPNDESANAPPSRPVNIQTFVLVVVNPQSKVWVVGTDYQRPFTKASAEKVKAKFDERLPTGWNCFALEITPVGAALPPAPPQTAASTAP